MIFVFHESSDRLSPTRPPPYDGGGEKARARDDRVRERQGCATSGPAVGSRQTIGGTRMVDKKGANGKQRRLRSRDWFDAPGDPTMAALYLERYLNFGLT